MNVQDSPFTRFLRWSERFTKTDMVYLVRGGSWLLFGNIAVTLLSFAVLYAFANFIPQQVYGEYRFVISLFEILYITTLSGLVTSLSQAVASGFDGNFKEIVRTRLAYGLIGTVIAASIGFYYLLNGNMQLGSIFLIFAIAVPLFPTSQLYTSYLLGKKNFKLQALYGIYARIATAAVMIPVLYFSSDIILILAAFFVSNITINVLLSWLTFKKEPPNTLVKSGSIAFGTHVSVVETFSIVATNIDKLIMWKFLGPVQLASFLIACAIPQELITRIVGIFMSLAFPKFGENQSIHPIDVLRKILRISIFMLLPVGLYIAAVPSIFHIFFPQYIEITFYAQLLSLILVFAPFMIISTYFAAQKMTRKLYLASIGELLIKIGLFLPLVYFYGIQGAVIATICFFMLRSMTYVALLLSGKPSPLSTP